MNTIEIHVHVHVQNVHVHNTHVHIYIYIVHAFEKTSSNKIIYTYCIQYTCKHFTCTVWVYFDVVCAINKLLAMC